MEEKLIYLIVRQEQGDSHAILAYTEIIDAQLYINQRDKIEQESLGIQQIVLRNEYPNFVKQQYNRKSPEAT